MGVTWHLPETRSANHTTGVPPASPGRGGLSFLMGVVVPHLRKYQKVGWPKPRGHVLLFSNTFFCLAETSLVEMAANFPLNFPFSP